MKKTRVLLMDGDMIAFRHAAAAEAQANDSVIDWGDGVTSVIDRAAGMRGKMDHFIEIAKQKLKADKVEVFISDPDCFRQKLNTGYKSNRDDKKRPPLLSDFKKYLMERHGATMMKHLEADDCMGILATNPANKEFNRETVIVSIDKDMRQIPGLLYNPFPHKREPKLERIALEQADYHFYFQTLVGDVIDGYKGAPGIGPVKARKILDESPTWEAVVGAFVECGQTEVEALAQARMARILRFEDFDNETGVKLWHSTRAPSAGAEPTSLGENGDA